VAANPAVANPPVAAPAANAPAAAAAVPGAVKPGAPAPAAAPAAVAQPAAPAAQPAATAGSGALVLKATEDSWITIQPPGKKALVSRMLKAGSTETFDIPEPALLIVGKPLNVQATLHGAPLELPPVPGGTISRVNIK
jgi:cytoskeleton protein RodZ